MIMVKDLVKDFGLKRAINHLDLRVSPGDILGIVGPDGAGKTTLLRMLCGILRPDSGTILIMGQNPGKMDRKRLGYMPQRFSLYPDLTIRENIDFFGAMYGIHHQAIRRRTAEILEITGLSPFVHRLASQLSGGMKQKLSLTCALITNPSILILDEPTYGVDPLSRREFWRMLYDLNDIGQTIVFTTPYMDEAELCKKVAFINRGRLSTPGSPSDLIKNYPHLVVEIDMVEDPSVLLKIIPGAVDYYHYANQHRFFIDKSIPWEHLKNCLEGYKKELTFKTVAPTMEEVFVYLAEKEGSDYD